MKILLIEDEIHLSEALTQILKNNDFEVDCALDGEIGLKHALLESYDLLLLDVMLPQLDGFKLLKIVREYDKTTPVILLTARNDVSDKIFGLDYGANDYILKPFNSDELLARIRVQLRAKDSLESKTIKYGDVILNLQSQKLCSDFSSIYLNEREVQLFDYFFKNNSIIIPFEKILQKLDLKKQEQKQEQTNEYVEILKKKLMQIQSNINIITINDIGYKLTYKEQCGLWDGK